jgi:hypothetical protein
MKLDKRALYFSLPTKSYKTAKEITLAQSFFINT